MGQKKLQRFAEIKTFENVLEYPVNMQGNWAAFFKNNNRIILELACGKGEYAVNMARLYAHQNFIGVDIKGNRMWVGAKKALDEELTNVAFLRTQIEKITDYFMPGEIAETWITFPDPQLAASRAKKRLTFPRFLKMYQAIMPADGVVHLKTDSPHLYDFTKKVIDIFNLSLLEDYDDVYSLNPVPEVLKIKTHYEKLDIAQSSRIHYLKFKLDKPFDAEKEALLKHYIRHEEVTGR